MSKLRTPEDIQALPGYIPKIDPRVTPLKRILDYYYIRPFEIKCGLCGKTHMDGCIVELENGNKSGTKPTLAISAAIALVRGSTKKSGNSVSRSGSLS
jgi:hypothetical protein